MTGDAQELARQYLSDDVGVFWKWSDTGDAIVWAKTGQTIAFREEIEAVLRVLCHGRLPRFSTVVMLLAACRESWLDAAAVDGPLWSLVATYRSQGKAGAEQAMHLLGDVIQLMAPLHELARSRQMTVDHKRALVEQVFGQTTATFAEHGEGPVLMQALDTGLLFNPAHPPGKGYRAGGIFDFNQTLVTLRTTLREFDAEAFDLRRETGLEQLPTEAPLDEEDLALPAVGRVRKLIRALRDDAQTSGVAELAQHLMAAIHLPRPVSSPEALPLGGVSDISNRGTPDRLLTSELAHDADTLLTRLALGEALYLRRENPPQPPPTRRAILIDTGVRMWGLPRLYAAAVALAFAGTSADDAELTALRSQDDGVEPVDLASRAGLAEHLGMLSASADVSDCLAELWRQSDDSTELVERVLITHEAALASPDFRRRLMPPDDRPLFVATVSRRGDFALWSFNRIGRRRLVSARFDVSRILGGQRSPSPATSHGRPLLREDVDPDLPVIFSARPFPLRLPHPAVPERSLVHEDHGVISTTADGRLLHWIQRGFGPVQVTDLLPRAKPLWMKIDNHGRVRLLIGRLKDGRLPLITADLRTGACSRVLLAPKQSQPMQAFESGGALVLGFRRRVEVFDVDSGHQLTAQALPAGVRPRAGRFFFSRANHGEWYAMAFDGRRVHLDRVELPPQGGAFERGPILWVFDRPGHDGPWALTKHGWLICLAGERAASFTRPLPSGIAHVEASADGNRLKLLMPDAPPSDPGELVLDLTTNHLSHGPLEPRIERLTIGRSFGKQYDHISVTRFGLVLPPYVLPFAADRFRWSNWTGGTRPGRAFGSTFRPPGLGIRLRATTWPDGSKAYLDSRGMLHLKSSNPQVPEMTLVTNCEEGQVTGWTSSGSRIGDPYFHGHAARAEADVFVNALKDFASYVPQTTEM